MLQAQQRSRTLTVASVALTSRFLSSLHGKHASGPSTAASPSTSAATCGSKIRSSHTCAHETVSTAGQNHRAHLLNPLFTPLTLLRPPLRCRGFRWLALSTVVGKGLLLLSALIALRIPISGKRGCSVTRRIGNRESFLSLGHRTAAKPNGQNRRNLVNGSVRGTRRRARSGTARFAHSEVFGSKGRHPRSTFPHSTARAPAASA